MLDNMISHSTRNGALPDTDDRARSERLERIRAELHSRARRVFPALPQGQLSAFVDSLAGHRAQEEERRAAARS